MALQSDLFMDADEFVVDAARVSDTLVSLTAAFVLGTLIGAERQYRQRTYS